MKLHYLHISDLHFTYKDMDSESWTVKAFNQNIVALSMLEAIKKITDTGRQFDFIIITGDIAQSGTREEFLVAEKFIEELLKRTDVPQDRLYLVPGNHDLDRSTIKKFHRKMYSFDSQDEISELLNDPESLHIFTRKFEAFNHFVHKVTGRRLYDETTFHMVESLKLNKGNQSFKVNLVGLNSSLFAGYDGDDDKKLALGLLQTDKALKQLDDEALFTIGFFHHPFSCFHPEDQICKNRLTNKMDIILTGHLHEPSGGAFRNTAGEAVILGAGVLYETRESKNSFNCVEIDLTNAEGKVFFFKYLPAHDLWKADTDVNPQTEDGHFPFSLIAKEKKLLKDYSSESSKRETESAPELQQDSCDQEVMPVTRWIHSYLLPDNFVGRSDEIERITTLLQGASDGITGKRASLITVKAIGGMGKSCMVRKIVEDLRDKEGRFQHIIWFSFYDARTEDEGFFFQRLLEELDISFKPSEDGNAIARTKRISEKIRSHLDRNPCLFVLDGLEVIQETADNRSFLFGTVQTTHREINTFLSHICNQKCSTTIVTSRVSLSAFSGVSGYLEIPLQSLSGEAGAVFFEKTGVEGTNEERVKCSTILGGHLLSLKLVAQHMLKNKIPAKDLDLLIGDPHVFASSHEAERITKIMAAYKKDLSEDQVYFLTMLSIHPRAVTEKNFPILVKRFDPMQKDSVCRDIIEPLKEIGLIEQGAEDEQGFVSYASHPLVKYSFSSWLNERELQQSHETWAKVAESSPELSHDTLRCKTLNELQPYLDVVEHYIVARKYKAAWDVYSNKKLRTSLFYLGYIDHLLDFSKSFEEKIEQKELDLSPMEKSRLWQSFREVYASFELSEKAINYVKKQGHAAEEVNDQAYTLECALVLVQGYSLYGHLKEAENLLTQLKEQNENVSNEYLFTNTKGVFELCAGNYSEATSLIKLYKDDDSFNRIAANTFLSEALIRSGNIEEAQTLYAASLKRITEENIQILQGDLLFVIIFIQMKENDMKQAREFADKRIELRKSMNLPVQENGYLLVAEGKYDQAIRESSAYLSTAKEPKYNKSKEIEALLITSKAWHGKGDSGKASHFFDRATELMNETGCWREKDQWEEIQAMLLPEKTVRKLPVGISDFDTIINDKYFYIDKTNLIQEVWENPAQVLLLPRPRRFGKTLNLQMLCSFFERTVKPKGYIFSNLNISKWEKYADLSGKFPVIFLTFKDVKGDNWGEVSEKIKRIISSEYERHGVLLENPGFSDWNRECYEKIIRREADLLDYEDSLKNLTQHLYNHYQQKVIVLIDEYDMPMQELYKKSEDYEKSQKFFRNLFSGLLKDNANLEKGLLTGILRVAKESIFSGLNNVSVSTLLDNGFSDKFGLTEDEIDKSLAEFNLSEKKAELEEFYNGYNFGNTKIYNPWSVINYLEHKLPKPYWIKTSANELIHDLLMKKSNEIVKDKVRSLLQGSPISVRLNDDIVFSDIDKKEENIWTFLVFTGYLTAIKDEDVADSLFHKLSIPNKEVRLFFKETVLEWLEEEKVAEQVSKIHKAILEQDYKSFETELQDVSKNGFSFHDAARRPELFYHAFTLGLLMGLEGSYEIDSNRESGYGRYDIMLLPKKENLSGVIFEFKNIDKEDKKDAVLDDAINQIKTMEYASLMKRKGIKKIAGVGIVFCGKKVWVKDVLLD